MIGLGLVLGALVLVVSDFEWRSYMSTRTRYSFQGDLFDRLFDATTFIFGDHWHGEMRS